MIVSRWTNCVGALIFLALGLFFIIHALDMELGTPRRMGPGYFPLVLGILVSILSVCVVVKSFIADAEIGRVDIRSFGAVSAGVAAFAAITPYFGIIPAAFISVLVSSLADSRLSLFKKGLLAASVSLSVWVIFIVGLQLTFSAFRLP